MSGEALTVALEEQNMDLISWLMDGASALSCADSATKLLKVAVKIANISNDGFCDNSNSNNNYNICKAKQWLRLAIDYLTSDPDKALMTSAAVLVPIQDCLRLSFALGLPEETVRVVHLIFDQKHSILQTLENHVKACKPENAHRAAWNIYNFMVKEYALALDENRKTDDVEEMLKRIARAATEKWTQCSYKTNCMYECFAGLAYLRHITGANSAATTTTTTTTTITTTLPSSTTSVAATTPLPWAPLRPLVLEAAREFKSLELAVQPKCKVHFTSSMGRNPVFSSSDGQINLTAKEGIARVMTAIAEACPNSKAEIAQEYGVSLKSTLANMGAQALINRANQSWILKLALNVCPDVVTCNVCLNSPVILLDGCAQPSAFPKHEFCSSCWKSHIACTLDNQSTVISCIAVGCE